MKPKKRFAAFLFSEEFWAHRKTTQALQMPRTNPAAAKKKIGHETAAPIFALDGDE
jgi:hypothetical protein